MPTEINLSANTLFHFTSSAETLISILKRGFQPRFCLEYRVQDGVLNAPEEEEAVPMTCFCDLPLSLINSHLKFYGSYGIGMSKQWGIERGLGPVMYVLPSSSQMRYLAAIRGALDVGKPVRAAQKKALGYIEPATLMVEFASFMKPYDGKMWRNSANGYVVKRFYDEREWRYVPFLATVERRDSQYRLTKDEFLNKMASAHANDEISEGFGLDFRATDIKYLIVANEKEIVVLSDALDTMKFFTKDEVKVLKTKIMSSQQIEEDF